MKKMNRKNNVRKGIKRKGKTRKKRKTEKYL
jgi:hypothetical protein